MDALLFEVSVHLEIVVIFSTILCRTSADASLYPFVYYYNVGRYNFQILCSLDGLRCARISINEVIYLIVVEPGVAALHVVIVRRGVVLLSACAIAAETNVTFSTVPVVAGGYILTPINIVIADKHLRQRAADWVLIIKCLNSPLTTYKFSRVAFISICEPHPVIFPKALRSCVLFPRPANKCLC